MTNEQNTALLAESDAALVAAYAALVSSDLQRSLRNLADRLETIATPAASTHALFLAERASNLLQLAEMLDRGIFNDELRHSAAGGVDVGRESAMLPPSIRAEIIYMQALASTGWNRARSPDCRDAFKSIGDSARALLDRKADVSVVRGAGERDRFPTQADA